MSGTALKNTHTSRIPKAEFVALTQQVIEQLKKDFPSRRIEVMKHYEAKSDFGNLSIIMESGESDNPSDIASYLERKFQSREIVKNDSQYSFEYKMFQVDLHLVAPDKFQVFADYHSYNGVGILLGYLADEMGVTLGHTGLLYKHRIGEEPAGTIMLANNWPSILKILGLDYAVWQKGFHTLEDMFTFIASGKFFMPELYRTMEWKDIPAEIRLTIRLAMAKWVEENYPETNVYHPEAFVWMRYLEEAVPGFALQMEQQAEAHAQRKAREAAIREKFNGHLVSNWTGLTGRELGRFMEKLNSEFGTREALANWAFDTSPEEIQKHIKGMQ